MSQLRRITVFAAMLLWSCVAMAAATVITVNGYVQMTPVTGKPDQLAPGQRIESGAAIKTGENSDTSLRFDDGQMIALSSNTSFVVNEYKFNAHKPEEGNFLVSLLKGGMRAVTGIIGETSKNNVKFKTEVATMGIRGTDFQLYYDKQLYITVLEGAVVARNEGGEAVFDAKSQPIGHVADSLTIPRPTTADKLPAAATSHFRTMQMKPLSDTIRKPNPLDPTCGDRR